MIVLHTGNFHAPFAQGLVRDIRVRWALEEAGIPYETRLLSREDTCRPEYRALQPFGKIPAIEDDGLTLFESAAIVLYLGERSETLLPADRIGKARATAWVLAAVNTVEPAVEHLCHIDLFPSHPKEEQIIRPTVEQKLMAKLAPVVAWLEGKEYLEGRFTAADIIMASSLKLMRHTDIVAQHPVLSAYVQRCEARPAYQRALRDHLAAYEGNVIMMEERMSDTAELRSPVNGIDVEGLQNTVQAVRSDPALGKVSFHVSTKWTGQTSSETTVESYRLGGQEHARSFKIKADEPNELLGQNTAPNPQELLMTAVNACMMVGYVANAALRGITLEECVIETDGELDLRGFLGIDETVPNGYRNIDYRVRMKGNGTRAQYEEIHAAVMKTSPNYFNMAKPIAMNGTLVDG